MVPLVEVLALDEMLPVVLVLESTVALALAVEAGESAEPELTLDSADGVLVFAEDSAEVEDAGDARPPEVEGVSSALLEEADAGRAGRRTTIPRYSTLRRRKRCRLERTGCKCRCRELGSSWNCGSASRMT